MILAPIFGKLGMILALVPCVHVGLEYCDGRNVLMLEMEAVPVPFQRVFLQPVKGCTDSKGSLFQSFNSNIPTKIIFWK